MVSVGNKTRVHESRAITEYDYVPQNVHGEGHLTVLDSFIAMHQKL